MRRCSRWWGRFQQASINRCYWLHGYSLQEDHSSTITWKTFALPKIIELGHRTLFPLLPITVPHDRKQKDKTESQKCTTHKTPTQASWHGGVWEPGRGFLGPAIDATSSVRSAMAKSHVSTAWVRTPSIDSQSGNSDLRKRYQSDFSPFSLISFWTAVRIQSGAEEAWKGLRG